LRKVLYKFLLAVNILFASALLVSYLAVSISPARFVFPAFFGLAYPYLAIMNILLALTWAIFRKYEALISIVIIAAGFTHIRNYIRIGNHNFNKENTFKVVSYNLRLFNYFESQNTNSEKKVLAFLKTQKSDILCLQEFYVNGDPVLKDSEVKKALGGGYYSHMKVIGSGKNRYYGIATYSKFPIAGRGEIQHKGSSSMSIYTDIVIRTDTFRIFNNHLQSFRLKSIEKSFFEEMTTPDEKEILDEVGSVSSSLKKGFIRRAGQAQALKAAIDTSPYPVIVAGDFNDTPVSYAYMTIRKGLNDSFVSSGTGAGFTYRGNYPPNRIDYILYDNALECMGFDILRVKYSDHFPISTYFRKTHQKAVF
jgi:endonuclease/exonuclease/phosphatase family metal-dependent hydrolase